MKYIFLITLLLSINANAQNLEEILDYFKTSKKVQALKSKLDSKLAQNNYIGAYSAPVLGSSISYADDISQDGTEYSIGLSQELINPFSTLQREDGVKSLNRAATQETKHEIHLLELDLVSKYYGACSAKEIRNRANELHIEQAKRYKQVEYAYKLGEISKKELLFNKLDLVKLQRSLNLYRLRYLEELSALQRYIDKPLKKISCDDLIMPSRDREIVDISQHNELQTLSFKKRASKSFYEMYDTPLESLSYELLFEKELETSRYTLGINFPIGGMSSQQEELRSSELAMASSYEFQKDTMKIELQNALNTSVSKLELLYDDLTLLDSEVLPLNRELLELAKLAHLEGEGSVLEYLDASRSYSENLLNILELKKTYYYELFEFYKIADKEYGEQL